MTQYQTEPMYLRVDTKLQQADFDAYLIQDAHNRDFLCNKGNYCLPGTMLCTKQGFYLATPSRNLAYFQEIYPEYHVLAGGVVEIADICKTLGIQRLGYEADLTSKLAYDALCIAFAPLQLVDAPRFIEDLRLIKTDHELALLQEATRISDKAYLEFLNHIKIGQTEAEARNIFNDIMMRFGADGFSFETLLSSGARCFLPHSAPTDKVIAAGDFVLMDFGIQKNGYCSDTSRTIVMGQADSRQAEAYQLVLDAQLAALEGICAGMNARQADAIARDIICAKMPDACYDYGLGHGIGRQVHEAPRMHPSNQAIILQENMVVSVEPGVYIKGWGGIRIEDVLVIKKGRGVNLTTAPKHLIEI
ncbi:MAG: M24 family metallopeptidase [Faecalibacterium sp.]